MDLEAITTFLAVVETGSVQGAAARLKVARATVRRHLEELEASVGAPLIHRTRQGAEPTWTGQLLAKRGRAVLEQARVLLGSIRELNAVPTGELRVVAPVGLPTPALAAVAHTMMRLWPGLRFDLQLSARPVDHLAGDAHVAVTFDAAVPTQGVEVLELAKTREWLVASPEYLDQRGNPTTPAGLAAHDLLVWSSPEGAPELLPTLDGQLVPVSPRYVTADVHLLRLMAARGAGIAYVPDARLPPGVLDEAPLVPVLADVIGRSRSLLLVVPEVLADIPRVRAVVDVVRSMAGPRA
ncbi:MAG: LysR family transcriptional regulator [Myxococcales bacterium]